jgi:hypothetical protein
MSITKLKVSLDGLEVGISGAVPPRAEWSESAMDRGILEFVSLLSGLLLKYGGRIVHGSQPSFTPVILRQARLHAGHRDRPPVTLVVSDLWARDWEQDDFDALSDVADLLITKSVGTKGIEDTETRSLSLKKMRRVLAALQNTMVAVGGKQHGADRLVAGVKEEMQFAQERGLPRFLIGGLGGYSEKMARRLAPESLDNHLPRKSNITLMRTHDVGASVNVLFEHMCMSEKLRASVRAPCLWSQKIGAIVDPKSQAVQEEISESVLRFVPARSHHQSGDSRFR